MQQAKNKLNLLFKKPEKWDIYDDEIKTFLPSFNIQKRIGDESVYGSIYEIDCYEKYVIKLMKVKGEFEQKMYNNEIQIGKKNGIEKCGVRILASVVLNQTWNAYVMTHALDGKQKYHVISLNDYLKLNPKHKHIYTTLHQKHPNVKYDKKVLKLFSTRLTQFYKLTQGFHGDLHLGNVMVILNTKYDVHDIK